MTAPETATYLETQVVRWHLEPDPSWIGVSKCLKCVFSSHGRRTAADPLCETAHWELTQRINGCGMHKCVEGPWVTMQGYIKLRLEGRQSL